MSHLSLRAVLITVAVFLLASVPAFSDSQVRTVRLSYVEGGVQIARGSAQEFEKAMVNLPITQSTRLRTAQDGRAEVEFEDGSTVRLAPNSSIEFPQLVLRDSGGKASSASGRPRSGGIRVSRTDDFERRTFPRPDGRAPDRD